MSPTNQPDRPEPATAKEPSLEETRTVDPAQAAGTVIGRYRLLQKIGEGGMGEVWLAEQQEPVRRRVALKLIKAGMNTREVIARFESERQALAMMEHSAIAKVFDAGSTPQGSPYFVMEYVAGIPITDYCDRHKLSTRERLVLFQRVCEGVQHAHQKAIIHRDLKPSNILVTQVDGRAEPKIIDFGVAKALTSKLTNATVFTRLGALVGTPQYMSPEQAISSGEDIDTRTDVYSLGIIFYELLAGAPPLDLRRVALDEFLRRLREEEPRTPSSRIGTHDRATSTEVARNRQTEPLALAKQLRGDLDSIALKALEKERARRYSSPSDFAADIQRHLNHEPVLAVAASAAYRARRFARRHRGALLAVAAFAVVLILAAGVSIWQSIRATAQRNRADAEAAIAKAVTQFLQQDLLSQASTDSQGGAENKPDPDVKVRTLLDRAASQVGKRFGGQPLVEAEIRETIANTYRNLGLYDEAEPQMRRAYELSRDHRGADDLATILILQDLSLTVSDLGKRQESLTMTKTVFDAMNRKLGLEEPRTVVAMQTLGVDYLLDGDYREAEPLLKKALEIQTRRLGPDNFDTLTTSDSLATLYIFQAKYPEADALLTKGLASYRRIYGPAHPFTQREMYGLGRVLYGEGKYREAGELVAQVLAGLQRSKGVRHPDTLNTAVMLAEIHLEEGRVAESESLLTQTIQAFRETLGPSHLRTLQAEVALGRVYDSRNDLVRAEQVWQGALEGFRRLSANTAGCGTSDVCELLGWNLIQQRKYDRSESILRQALAAREAKDRDDWRFFRAQALLGASLAGEGKYADAEPLLLSGYEGLNKREAAIPAFEKRWIPLSGDRIVTLYSRWSKPEQAAQWRARLQAQPAK